MGKYIRKCKRIGRIAVMEVSGVGGARTRARGLALAAARRRKVSVGELNVSPSLARRRSRREGVVTTEDSVSPATSDNSRERTVANASRCSSPISDQAPASCCSSNGSSSSLKFVDLEGKSVAVETSTYDFNRRERREMTPSSELRAKSAEPESNARQSEADSRRRSPVKKRPSEAELEEFFAAAEKDTLKRFTEKYNFDFVNDVPLEGRYKWARLA